MKEYIYRIAMRDGERIVAVRPAWFMDLLTGAIADDGLVTDDDWLLRGSEIAHVKREEVAQ